MGDLLSESRIPGSNGAEAQKLSVRLYGRGVVPKINDRRGSAATKYYRRRAGQLIYSKLDFLNGAFGIIPPELDGYESTLDLPCFDINAEVDKEWLLALLTQPAFYGRYKVSAVGSRKARRVGVGEFLASRVTIPGPAEQRAIARILGAVDDMIRKTESLVAQLETVKKAAMTELLSHGLPGRHMEYKKTPFGRIPVTWDIRRVGELAKFSGGHGFRPPDWSDEGLPIIRIQNLNGSPKFNYFAGKTDPRWIVEPGTLLFAWAGTRGVSFGPTIWNGPTGVLNQHIYRVEPKAGVERLFLYWALWRITTRIERKAHGFKTTLVHVQKSDITDAVVPLPPRGEQCAIAAAGASLDGRLAAERRYLEQLRTAKRGLAQALLSGRIRVGGAGNVLQHHLDKPPVSEEVNHA